MFSFLFVWGATVGHFGAGTARIPEEPALSAAVIGDAKRSNDLQGAIMTQERAHEIIAMLNQDAEGEHGAIIQYLLHAYALGEGEFAAEIEAVARDEMRHLRWLAEAVVELGGKPSLKLGPVTYQADEKGAPLGLGPGGPTDWMEQDVGLERDAITLYRSHASAIDDPGIVRLLNRIISDEERHERIFNSVMEEISQEGIQPELIGEGAGAGEDTLPPRTLEILQEGISHEYTVILQYLYHSFFAPCEIGEELEMQAINEMQHMGWFAEEVAGKGIVPGMSHHPFDRSEDPAEMLRADIAAERSVTMDYEQQLKELEDPKLKKLFSDVRDHEIYHDELFGDILTKIERAKAARPIATIGSLLGKKQS
jgi:bacterioferritin